MIYFTLSADELPSFSGFPVQIPAGICCVAWRVACYVACYAAWRSDLAFFLL
jgi:hypothetical protein